MIARAHSPTVEAIGPAAQFAVFGPSTTSHLPPLDAWLGEVPDIIGERASGLATQRVHDAAGTLPDEVRDILGAAHRADTMGALAIAGMTLPFLDVLRDRGIAYVLIKGLAVARHHPRADLRPFRDVDIVVAPERFDEALRLAHSRGLQSVATDLQPHPSFDLHCREGLNLASENGLIRLDLHHHVGPWALSGNLDFQRLDAQAETIVIHGHEVRVAGSVHCLAVALLHLISEQWQKKLSLLTWSDIALLSNSVDPGAIVEEFGALQLGWLLGAIVAELPPGSRPAALIAALGSPTAPRAAGLRLRLLDASSAVGRHPASWAARLPLANAIFFLGGSLVPSRAYLRSRFGDDASYRTWWAQAFRWARRAAGGDDVSSPYSSGRT